MSRIFLPNEQSTIEWGRKLGEKLRPGDIVKITGPLGAGKTTLTRGVIVGLGGDPDQVHSPTFSIVHEYESPIALINHCDFYRLGPDSDLAELGGLEFFDEEKIYILEWPDRTKLLESITPDRLIDVDLGYDSGGRRLQVSSTRRILD